MLEIIEARWIVSVNPVEPRQIVCIIYSWNRRWTHQHLSPSCTPGTCRPWSLDFRPRSFRQRWRTSPQPGSPLARLWQRHGDFCPNIADVLCATLTWKSERKGGNELNIFWNINFPETRWIRGKSFSWNKFNNTLFREIKIDF